MKLEIFISLIMTKGEIDDNYYKAWIETYAGKNFEGFSIRSLEFLDNICKGINKEEEEELLDIYFRACDYEMGFLDMSYE